MIAVAVLFMLVFGALLFVALPSLCTARGLIATMLFIVTTIIVFVGSIDILGRPKPFQVEWRNIRHVQVLATLPIENEAIYAWVLTTESPEPRAYVMPWTQKSAQQLQDAMNKAEADGTAVQMTINTEGADGGEPMFYAPPQPPMPAKNYLRVTPQIVIEAAPNNAPKAPEFRR